MKLAPLSLSSIKKADQLTLFQAPLSTPLLISVGSPQETTLAMRVEELFSFRRKGLSADAQLVSYQAKEGVWVIVVAFRLSGFLTKPLGGIVYLNPREAPMMAPLLPLTKQERFPFVFLSPRQKVMVSHDAPWSVHQRQEVRLLLSQLHSTSGGQPTAGQQNDLEFVRARQEFERVSTGRNLLVPSLTTGRSGSVFSAHGVVLE